MKRLLPAVALFCALGAVAQTNQGPFNAPRINSTYYVGSTPGWYPTIQSAVTAACSTGINGVVNIPPAYGGTDPISGITGGCTAAYLVDARSLPTACYAWSGSAYSSASCETGGGGGSITLTTNNTNGTAALSGSALNVPHYVGVASALTAGHCPEMASNGIDLVDSGAACGTGSGGVSSFNTRTGAVAPASGDYTVSQVTGAAPLASPALTGTPTAPTPSTGDNSTNIATTAYTRAYIASLAYVTGSGTSGHCAQWGASNTLGDAGAACGSGSGGITQLTGDVTAGPGTGSQAATLATVNSSPGACGSSTSVCVPTTNGKGLVTSQTTAAIPTAASGTNGLASPDNSTITSSSGVFSVNQGYAYNWTDGQLHTLGLASIDKWLINSVNVFEIEAGGIVAPEAHLPFLQAGEITVVPFALIGSSPTISPTAAGFQNITLSGNTTPTLGAFSSQSNPWMTIEVCQPNTAYTWTWPAGINGGYNMSAVPPNTCATQSFFSWDGATLTAMGPAVINGVVAGGGAISVVEKDVQQIDPGAIPVDPNTGLTAAGGAGTNVQSVVNAWLAANSSPTQKAIVRYDAAYVGNPIMGPASGNWGVDGLGAGVARIKITAWNCNGTTCTFTILPQTSGIQQLTANQSLQIGGTGTALDGGTTGGGWLKVLSTGLSSTQFEASSSFSGTGTSATAEADFLWGTGPVAAIGSNDDVIRAGGSTSAGGCTSGNEDAGWISPGEAPSMGTNVSITNILVNGERYQTNGTAGNSTGSQVIGGNNPFPSTLYSTSSPYCTYKNINIQNTAHVLIENVVSYNAPSYNIKFDNTWNTWVRDSAIYEVFPNQTATPHFAGDGVHYSGPDQYGYIDGTTIFASDDAVAYNAPEGHVGLINHMHITNSSYGGFSLSGVRAYTGSIAPPSGDATPLIGSDMTADNYSGTSTSAAGLFGLFSGARTMTVANSVNYMWSDSHVTAPGLMMVDDSFGSLTFNNVQSDGSTCTNGNGFINTYENAVSGAAINLNDVRINRTSAGHCTVAAIDTADDAYGGSSAGALTLPTLNINGFAVNDVDGGSYGAMAQMLKLGTGTTIANVEQNGVDSKNITAVLTGAGAVTNFGGMTISGGGNYNCASGITIGSSSVCPGAGVSLLLAVGLNHGFGQLVQEDDEGGTNTKLWDSIICCSTTHGSQLSFRMINDADTAANNWMQVTRSGDTAVSVALPEPIIQATYTVATLPAASVGAGATVVVTDAASFTPGTCTGGGSDTMVAVSNGTSWSCH